MTVLPRLIAVDLDDTLIQHGDVVVQEVIDAFALAKSKGAYILPATGRSMQTAIPVARAAGLDGLAVTSNGAILGSIETEKVLESVTFDPTPVLNALRERLPNAIFAVEDDRGVFHATEITGHGTLGYDIRIAPWERLCEEPVVRVVVRSDEHVGTGFAHLIEDLGLHEVVFGIAEVAWMDIGPMGVSKASMLESVRQRMHIPIEQTMAFGDSWNDLQMLKWAGTGVAMSFAPDAVRDAADRIAGGIPGISVAEVVTELFS